MHANELLYVPALYILTQARTKSAAVAHSPSRIPREQSIHCLPTSTLAYRVVHVFIPLFHSIDLTHLLLPSFSEKNPS